MLIILFLQGSCTWSGGNGRKVTLTTTSLVNLSNVERLALQKISLAKIQAMDLGCAITIPKGKTAIFVIR